MYMAGMAYAFDAGWLGVAQVLAAKPNPARPAPRPWTRRYQYDPEIAIRSPGPWTGAISDALCQAMMLRDVRPVDCDLHPAPPRTADLLPYLDEHWREQMVGAGDRSGWI